MIKRKSGSFLYFLPLPIPLTTMTSTIPPHYSNRHVQQRYNKALQIVQHLSVSSFQPTKDQKLQVYQPQLPLEPSFLTRLFYLCI